MKVLVVGLAILSLAAGGCAPRIDRFDISGSTAGSPPRAAVPVTAVLDVTPFQTNVMNPRITLRRILPTATSFPVRNMAQTSASGVVPENYTVAFAPNDPTPVPLDYGSSWEAELAVPYRVLWTDQVKTQTKSFAVGAPPYCISFDPGSEGWVISGFKDVPPPGQGQVRAIAAYPSPNDIHTTAANYPQVFAATGALKLTIPADRLRNRGSGYNSYWMIEFTSPVLGGSSGRPDWQPVVPSLSFQASTQASDISVQPLVWIEKVVGPGPENVDYTFLYPVATAGSTYPVLYPVASDGNWQSVSWMIAPYPDGTHHLWNVILRVYGRYGDLDSNDGKQVFLDFVCHP